MDKKFSINNAKWVTGSHGLPEVYIKFNIPSVTRIISDMIPDPELEEWIRKVGKEKSEIIMKNAGDRGTSMHLFIENFINTYVKTKSVSDALRYTQEETPKTLLSINIPESKINEGRDLFYKFYYSDFIEVYKNLIGTELGVFSPTYFYRGKTDIFYNDRIYGPAITDFKSASDYIKKGSVKEYKYKCQLGGYALPLDEMYANKNLVIKRASILCITKAHNELQEIKCEGKELEKFKEEFKTLVKKWHINNNNNFIFNNSIIK